MGDYSFAAKLQVITAAQILFPTEIFELFSHLYSQPCGTIVSMQINRQTDVLLIDDSVTDLRLLMEMMTARQLRVSVAFDGEKGYRQAELLRPGLILLDVRMPGMDGFAVCRRLKSNPATHLIPIIFLTAATDIEERLQGFALGGVDYIGKPFNEQEVLARVGVHLQQITRERFVSTEGDGTVDAENDVKTLDAVLVSASQKILRQSMSSLPSLDALARQVGTNRRRINEAFQAYCGLSAFEWLREERLRQAHYLVGSTDTPLSQISEYLGYSTPTNFAKSFRERYGCPPRTLRKEMQAKRALDE